MKPAAGAESGHAEGLFGVDGGSSADGLVRYARNGGVDTVGCWQEHTASRQEGVPMGHDWSSTPIYPILQALGRAIEERQLYPETLAQIPQGYDVWPNHFVSLYHRSGHDLGQRKGKYVIEIVGPVYAGLWSFQSGQLEILARSTIEGSQASE